MADIMRIEITLNDQQQVAVNGTIENKMLTLGLIEVAKEAIIKLHDSKAQERIIAPASGIMIPRA